MTNVLAVVPANPNARSKQSPRVMTNSSSILNYAPTAEHALKFARSKQSKAKTHIPNYLVGRLPVPKFTGPALPSLFHPPPNKYVIPAN